LVPSLFKKLRKLGSGGFGEVWMAERNHDKRQFAIKFLLVTDPESVARFQREVRCLSQLDHPNIVRVTSKSLAAAPYWYAMPPYDHSLYDELSSIVANHERVHGEFLKRGQNQGSVGA
jgi:serine/threonine protein kinase